MQLEFPVKILAFPQMTVMTRPIEFDSKLGFLAKEINDAIADRVLATKL